MGNAKTRITNKIAMSICFKIIPGSQIVRVRPRQSTVSRNPLRCCHAVLHVADWMSLFVSMYSQYYNACRTRQSRGDSAITDCKIKYCWGDALLCAEIISGTILRSHAPHYCLPYHLWGRLGPQAAVRKRCEQYESMPAHRRRAGRTRSCTCSTCRRVWRSLTCPSCPVTGQQQGPGEGGRVEARGK